MLISTCQGQKPKALLPAAGGTSKHAVKDTVPVDSVEPEEIDSVSTTDAEEFIFNNIPCRAFKVDSRYQRVIIYCSSSHGAPPNSIRSIYTVNMKSQKQVPLMITNGGMFDPDYTPHGLMVSNKLLYKLLDTLSGNQTQGNFYLLPNGVFGLDKGKFFILPTNSFHHLYPDLALSAKIFKDIKSPEFATQSGPMLLLNDSINKNFTPGSKNRKIRSGVGLLPNGNPVFVISDGEINFYDFATLFQSRFHCRQALFLDGVISRMFIADIHAGETIQGLDDTTDGAFGPMIGVIKK